MIFLLMFAFLSGIMTVLSPCVLPVLPAILSSGASESKFRSYAIIIGLILSFTVFTLALKSLVQATGIDPELLRFISIGLIGFFGVFLLVPKFGEYFAEKTNFIADLGSNIQRYSTRYEILGGFVLGIALGLVWTPCAGPILAAVIAIAATSNVTSEVIFITLAYALGSALPMLLIILGSQKMIQSSRFLSRHLEKIRQGFGLIMIATAIALYFHAEVFLQQLTLKYFPTISIENNETVNKELNQLRLNAGQENKQIETMPNFKGISSWINSSPLTPESLRGKVVLVDFWTYSCINCIRTLPYLTDWYNKYHDLGLTIVGVHTPEFEFEKKKENVEDAVKRFKILYPVALDNDYGTWNAYSNHFWPAHYLFDQNGALIQQHFGEGKYLETENAIRILLGLQTITEQKIVAVNPIVQMTQETYLGSKRAASYVQDIVLNQFHQYSYEPPLAEDHVALEGRWIVKEEYIESGESRAKLHLNFIGTRVYLVMEAKNLSLVDVRLDGKKLPQEYFTNDMDKEGHILVSSARKYDVINLRMHHGRHDLTLVIPQNVKLYAFTFGNEP